MKIETIEQYCRICKNINLEDVIKLGEQVITSRFPVYGDFSTPKSDIYELYQHGTFHSIAHVDTYKCSLWLNTLFYGPEESEIECNVKELSMECKWNETFKKWTPIKI